MSIAMIRNVGAFRLVLLRFTPIQFTVEVKVGSCGDTHKHAKHVLTDPVAALERGIVAQRSQDVQWHLTSLRVSLIYLPAGRLGGSDRECMTHGESKHMSFDPPGPRVLDEPCRVHDKQYEIGNGTKEVEAELGNVEVKVLACRDVHYCLSMSGEVV